MKLATLLLLFVAAAVIAGLAVLALAQPAGGPKLETLLRQSEEAAKKQPATQTPATPATPTSPSSPDAKEPKAVKTAIISRAGYDITPLSKETITELAKKLSPEDAKVILNAGTEPAFCGNLLDNKKDGTYACKLCGLPLFSSEHKFNSGTGWPSFFAPYATDHIKYVKDTAYGMVRVEILCNRCDGHLGHVFDDGPKDKTGLRYCLNSASMDFFEKGTPLPLAPIATKTAYFAGGCFWGIEHRYQETPGVVNAVSGYMGGNVTKPTYKQVCNEETGHAEVVKIEYNPAQTTYRQLLERFFKLHDPTQLNRQGPDVGSQYRSAIFAVDQAQLDEAKAFIAEQASNPRFKGRPIVTLVESAATEGPAKFWIAEDYHQDYNERTGHQCYLPE
jgi:peptide methionine sulfoxide reductase msrA/msrB